MAFLLQKIFQIIWLCNPLTISVLIKIIPETCLAHSIRYLPLYYLQMVQWFHQRTLRISLLNVFFSLGYNIITLSCGDDCTFVSCNNSITHVVSHKGFFVFVFFGINNTNQIASHKIYFFLAAILKSLNK
jgi:hypothetical protein